MERKGEDHPTTSMIWSGRASNLIGCSLVQTNRNKGEKIRRPKKKSGQYINNALTVSYYSLFLPLPLPRYLPLLLPQPLKLFTHSNSKYSRTERKRSRLTLCDPSQDKPPNHSPRSATASPWEQTTGYHPTEQPCVQQWRYRRKWGHGTLSRRPCEAPDGVRPS